MIEDTVIGTQFDTEVPEQMFEDVSEEELAKEAAEDTVAIPEPVAPAPEKKRRGRPPKKKPEDVVDTKKVFVDVGNMPEEEASRLIADHMKGGSNTNPKMVPYIPTFIVTADTLSDTPATYTNETVPLSTPEPVDSAVEERAAQRVREAEAAAARIFNRRRRGRG